MDKIQINGGQKLQGEVSISGAKNAALPLLAACVSGGTKPAEVESVRDFISANALEEADRVRIRSNSGFTVLNNNYVIHQTARGYALVEFNRPCYALRDTTDIVADRRDNGYRAYAREHIHKLRFVQRARSLGFTIEECRNLLSLYEDKNRASGEVKRLAEARLADIDRKLRELGSMRAALSRLIEGCRGDSRPDCPILDDLAGMIAPES